MKIKDLFPFVNLGADGLFHTDSIADRDTFAVGRGIRGDGLTNWEEYRGFMTVGDYNTYPYPDPKHERTDPRHKTVFKALSPRLEPDLVAVMPEWDSLLYKPNFNALDTSQYLEIKYVALELDPGYRNWVRIGRIVNTNQLGASFLYYGYNHPTNQPAHGIQTAVTFWEAGRQNLTDQNYMDREIADAHTWPYDTTIAFGYPNGISRIALNLSGILYYDSSAYYHGGGGIWQGGDYQKLMKYLSTHEFGHTIGIMHNYNQKTIMFYKGTPWNRYKLFYDPINWSNDFNSNDKSQATVKSENLP